MRTQSMKTRLSFEEETQSIQLLIENILPRDELAIESLVSDFERFLKVLAIHLDQDTEQYQENVVLKTIEDVSNGLLEGEKLITKII